MRRQPKSTLFPYTTLFRSVGKESVDQLGGPIRIAQVSGQVATAGFVPLVHLAAVLSISIGLLNLFPIPLLDRKSTRLNSSHSSISYAVFCLKKKKTNHEWH